MGNRGINQHTALPMPERFWSKVNKTGGCWEWTAASSHGYGEFRVGGQRFFAHRWAYEDAKGPIPEGLFLDHLCRNPPCVRPDHLEAVTPMVNSMRGVGQSALHAQKTHCKNGHLFTADSWVTWWAGRPRRVCKPCREATANRRAERMRVSVERRGATNVDD